MRKLLLAVLSVCLLCGLLAVSASAASENYGKSYYAPYGTPTIDGVRERAWDLAEWAPINVNAADYKMTARFKVMHDDYLIYFLVECEDVAVSTALKECIHMSIHSHTCTDADTCEDFETQYMAFKGTIWHKQQHAQASNANFKVLATKSANGTTYTLEWAYSPTDAIPKNSLTAFGLEMMADDYTADGSWLSVPQTWNSYSATASYNAGNFGKLYFKTASETGTATGDLFYNDVPETHEAYDAIVYASSQGLFVPASASNPSFYPDMTLTRAQFVTLLGRLAGANVASYTTTSFTDVNFARDKWFAGYAEWAKETGLVVGSQFMANKAISVSEAVVMLQRFAQNIDNRYTTVNTSLSAYADASAVPSWAKAGMQWAVHSGVYVPAGTTLNPTATVDRAAAAQLIFNYDTRLVSNGVANQPSVSVKEPPSNIDWEKEFEINALEFGFVNDGKTFNDDIMAYYLEHYSATVPLVFPAGTYAFQYQINFPTRIYIELAPRAELILMGDEVQDYFITLQLGTEEYGTFDDYAHHSYIRGGTINANYKAKVALGLSHGIHTAFENFKIRNVLEKGIQTEINALHNGNYKFTNIYLYNDTAIQGTIGFYDNSADNTYDSCTAVNFETCIWTGGGKFTKCSGWFNAYGKDLIPTSVYAVVRGGNQSVFTTPLVDTYRTGFKLIPSEGINASTGETYYNYPSTSITDMIWITNNVFYTSTLMSQYPMMIFDVYSDDCTLMVNGMYIPWREYGFAFSNIQLPSSSFLNVRYEAGWKPWNTMKNFRDDTAKLKKLINLYDWTGWTG